MSGDGKGMGFILSVGARSPLGLDARGVSLAYRAHKLAPRRFCPGDAGSPSESYGTARARCVADGVVGVERLLALGAPPLVECLATSPVPRAARTVVHLAVPDARPDPDPALGQPLLSGLAERAGLQLEHRESTVIAGGHAGFAVALERALETSRKTGAPALAGALDTYHAPDALRFLAREHRIHGPGVGDGFIPSEGAAFALVSAEHHGASLATVKALALGADTSDEQDDEDPRIGAAMTEVVGRALRAGGEVGWVMVDVNGERHRSKEWSFVTIRLRRQLDPEAVIVERPYEEAGDLGAATGSLFAVTACMAWQLGHAPARRVLLAMHADGPQRAAIVLEAP